MVPEVTLNDDDSLEAILTAAGLMSPDEFLSSWFIKGTVTDKKIHA